jgi:flagellar biosynthetic protein FliR
MDGLLETWVMTFGLILARVSAFVATIPYLGGRFVPRLVKAGTALALTCFWFTESGVTSLNVAVSMNELPWLAFSLAVAREVIIGCALGYVFGLFLVPFRVAGEYLSQEMGLTLGTITDPSRPQMTTVMGEVFELLGVVVFFAQNVHHVFLAALHGSFGRQPIGGGILGVPVAIQMKAMSMATEWGLMLVAPIACCLFITSLILGVMARVAPQLNLMSIGFSLRIVIGLVATSILWPDIAPQMGIILQRFSTLLMGR